MPVPQKAARFLLKVIYSSLTAGGKLEALEASPLWLSLMEQSPSHSLIYLSVNEHGLASP